MIRKIASSRMDELMLIFSHQDRPKYYRKRNARSLGETAPSASYGQLRYKLITEHVHYNAQAEIESTPVS